jgi:hypothetical protein
MSGGFDNGFSISPLAGGGGGGVPLNFSQTKGVQVTITALEAKPATVVSTTITTQGNPVQIIVAGDANPSAPASWGLLNIYRGGTAVGQLVQFESSAANENVPYCLQVVDEPAAGTWTYSLKVTSVTSDTQFGEAAGPIITVTELGAEAGGGGGGGTIGGSIATNQVGYGTAANTLGGSGDFTFDGTTLAVIDSGTTNKISVSATGGEATLKADDGSSALVELHVSASNLTMQSMVASGDFLSIDASIQRLTVVDPGTGVDSAYLEGGRVTIDAAGNTVALDAFTVPTITTLNLGSSLPMPLNLAIEALQVNSDPGAAGEVLTSNGVGLAPTWQAAGAGGFGSKVLLCVEGGVYATLQAAVDAASANDMILVGPKATGDWGNVLLNVVNKPLIIAAASGPGSNKIVKVGSITYDLGTTGPALNANLNETYLYGLYIQGSFPGGSAVTLTGGANYPGRLRCYGCYILNTSATGTAAVTNSNSGTNSSIYLDACVVSLTPSAAGSTIVQTAGYTLIRNGCDVSASIAAGATGSAITVSAGTIEIYDSSISISRAGNTASTINIPAASSVTTYVSAGYSTISNNSDTAGAACVNIGTAGATFGAGDATLAAGTSVATAAVAVKGIAGGSFLYTNISFSFSATASTVTATAFPQTGGLFAYGMSVGSLLATTFVLNSTGNITKLNNVTTSFPSAQGSANQVLTNNGSGTLTWANGNLRTLGSVGATPTAANLRTNATYTVNVAAVALPAMAAGDDGLTISLVNISGAGSTVTPSTGVARAMTTGGGQTWVWRNTGTTWYCLSNV